MKRWGGWPWARGKQVEHFFVRGNLKRIQRPYEANQMVAMTL
jgi:hypothetical protein